MWDSSIPGPRTGTYALCSVSRIGRPEAWDTTYVETGHMLRCGADATEVGEIPPIPEFHLFHVGDGCARPEPEAAERSPRGTWVGVRMTCRPYSMSRSPVNMSCSIKGSSPPPSKCRRRRDLPPDAQRRPEVRNWCREEMNLPRGRPPSGDGGRADLPLLRVAADHADMVALSFLHHERDVDTLRDYLDRVGAKNCGLVLK